ncbi:MliC family protein [Moraxella sp. ZJ142]|uniref:MliC family protein n=1 Tax=Moraxella marmotae TaxID=3344520 RepID=UPI0035D49FC0
MKKLLIASTAIAFAITGCASNPINVAKDKVQKLQHRKHGEHTPTQQNTQHATPSDKLTTGTRTDKPVAIYQCEQNANLIAKYLPAQSRAILTVYAPSWQLHHQEITMESAVTGSGMRFVNNTNPHSAYEWHVKGSEGILGVTIDGSEYTLHCQATAQSI